MWLFIAFLAVPLIEITLFIQIGGAIGLGWTLLTVVITAIAGTYLVRQQGFATLAKLQSSFSDLKDPTEPLVHGAMILFAGALLLTPGFFTDAVGLALMIPQLRQAAYLAIRSRVNVQTFETHGSAAPGQPTYPRPGEVIEGEYHEVPEDGQDDRPSGQSGWTKH